MMMIMMMMMMRRVVVVVVLAVVTEAVCVVVVLAVVTEAMCRGATDIQSLVGIFIHDDPQLTQIFHLTLSHAR